LEAEAGADFDRGLFVSGSDLVIKMGTVDAALAPEPNTSSRPSTSSNRGTKPNVEGNRNRLGLVACGITSKDGEECPVEGLYRSKECDACDLGVKRCSAGNGGTGGIYSSGDSNPPADEQDDIGLEERMAQSV